MSNHSNKNKISAVVISYNEERNMARCIESLIDVVDEIIVVDSFSTDQTKEICEKYNVRFYQHDWLGYSKTKNYANSLAKYDWILSLDSDEALSDELAQSLIHEKQNLNGNSYIFNRKANYCGQWINHCGWYPDKKIRLWKKDIAAWEGNIHEELIFKTKEETNSLNGDILHYSYYSISEHISQTNKFTDIAAEQMLSQNKKVSLLKLFFSPIAKFTSSYFFRLGFLDGFYGFVICVLSANASFLKYSKLRQLTRTRNKSE